MRKLAIAIAGLLVVGGAGTSAGTADAEPCTNMSRACILEVARTYVDAQAGLAPRDTIRAAPTAKRWENGVNTANSGAELTGAVAVGAPPVAALVAGVGITPRFIGEWVDVETGDAFFRWMMDVGGGGAYTSTAHILERIKVVADGCGEGPSPCITEIEATFCIGQTGQEEPYPSPRPGPQLLTSFLCHRSG